jgi:hypothetical protein
MSRLVADPHQGGQPRIGGVVQVHIRPRVMEPKGVAQAFRKPPVSREGGRHIGVGEAVPIQLEGVQRRPVAHAPAQQLLVGFLEAGPQHELADVVEQPDQEVLTLVPQAQLDAQPLAEPRGEQAVAPEVVGERRLREAAHRRAVDGRGDDDAPQLAGSQDDRGELHAAYLALEAVAGGVAHAEDARRQGRVFLDDRGDLVHLGRGVVQQREGLRDHFRHGGQLAHPSHHFFQVARLFQRGILIE